MLIFLFSVCVEVGTVKSLIDLVHFSKKHRYKPYMLEVLVFIFYMIFKSPLYSVKLFHLLNIPDKL
jgi:hypothetical protein